MICFLTSSPMIPGTETLSPSLLHIFSEVFNKLLGVGPDVFSIPRRPKQGIGFKKDC